MITFLYEWKFTSIIGDCWLYSRVLVIFHGFIIPFRLFVTDVLCHSIYQKQKRWTVDTKNYFKIAGLSILDCSYKVIVVARKLPKKDKIICIKIFIRSQFSDGMTYIYLVIFKRRLYLRTMSFYQKIQFIHKII